MIWNKGAADALLGIAAPGVGTLVEGVNATRLPTLTALSLGIGLLVTRGIMDQAVVAGSGIVYAGIAGIGSLDITYVCVLGRCTE